ALLIVVNLYRLEDRWSSIGRMTAFVVEGTSEAEAMQIARALKATDGIDHVRYLSSEVARSEMLENATTPLLESLPHSAFPASLEIELSAKADTSRAQNIASRL